jgi:hypothetical protein
VVALCQPFKSELMKANTISKLITTKKAKTNVEEDTVVSEVHKCRKSAYRRLSFLKKRQPRRDIEVWKVS